MSTLTKVLVAILVIFNIVLLGFAAVLFAHRVDYKDKYERQRRRAQEVAKRWKAKTGQLETQIQTLNSQNEDLIEEKEKLQNEISSLQEDLDNRRNDIQQLRSEVNEKENRIEKQETRIGDLSQEISEKSNQIDNIQKELQNTKDQLRSAVEDRDRFKTKLDQRKTNTSELQQRFIEAKKELKDKKKLLGKYKKKFGTIDDVEVAPPVEGHVKAVSDKMNLLIIDLGKQHDVEKGMKFSLIRGDQYVTEIKVVDARRGWSAARSIEDMQMRKPEVGDLVTSYEPAATSN